MKLIILLFKATACAFRIVSSYSFNKQLFCIISVNCTAGQYLDVDQVMCRPCERGTYQSKDRQSSCDDCPPGQTTLGEGFTAASDCVGECTI